MVFLLQNLVTHIFLAYFYLLNLYNTLWPAADNDPQNQWLTALEKSQFFRLFEILFIA